MTDRTEREGPPPNEMDELAERLASVLTGVTGDTWRPDHISLRMIAEFAWAFGLEPDFKLVSRPTEALAGKGGGDGQ